VRGIGAGRAGSPRPERWLRALLQLVAAFHILAGAGLAFSTSFQRLAAGLYGVDVAWGPREVYLVRVLGTFALFVGFAAAVAARRPVRHGGLIVSLAVLFVIRSVSRHLHGVELYEGFSVAPAVNVLTTTLFLALAVALLALLWVCRQAHSPSTGGPRE
jgi:hypothetical protein